MKLKTLKEIEDEDFGIMGNHDKFVMSEDLKQEAIKWIKEIQSGSGVDRTKFPEDMKGRIAQDLWNDGKFTLGVEYGFMIGLMEFLDITEEDLNEKV